MHIFHDNLNPDGSGIQIVDRILLRSNVDRKGSLLCSNRIGSRIFGIGKKYQIWHRETDSRAMKFVITDNTFLAFP